MQSNPEITKSLIELEKYDTEIRRKVEDQLKQDKEIFTFFFPKELTFYYADINVLLHQIHIFLHLINLPFKPKMNIELYYKGLFKKQSDIKVIFDFSRTTYFGEMEILVIHILGKMCERVTGQKVVANFNPQKLEFFKTWNFFKHFFEWGQPKEEIRPPLFPLEDINPKRGVLLGIQKISKDYHVGSVLDELKKKKNYEYNLQGSWNGE